MSEYKTLKELWDEHGKPGERLHVVDDYEDKFYMIDCGDDLAIGYDEKGDCDCFPSNCADWKLAPKTEVRLFPVIVRGIGRYRITTSLFETIEEAREHYSDAIRLATPDDLQNGVLKDWE